MPSPTSRPPYLGDLELTVLEHLWLAGDGDAKAVHRAVGRTRGITLNTVQSTMKRLHEKGLLDREKVSHAYVYSPAVDRECFHRRVLGEVMNAMMGGEPECLLAAFVDLTERAGPEHLERLERMVEARLKARKGEAP